MKKKYSKNKFTKYTITTRVDRLISTVTFPSNANFYNRHAKRKYIYVNAVKLGLGVTAGK